MTVDEAIAFVEYQKTAFPEKDVSGWAALGRENVLKHLRDLKEMNEHPIELKPYHCTRCCCWRARGEAV